MKQNLKFGLPLSWPAVLKISTILLKYPTFWAFFQVFTVKSFFTLYRTKKMVNGEVRKLEFFSLKCTFLVPKMLQTPIELWVALIAIAHWMTYIQ